MSAKYYSIDGYWKDTKDLFLGYIIASTHDVDDEIDDQIFFYGLTETDIQNAITAGDNTGHDFVITAYHSVTFGIQLTKPQPFVLKAQHPVTYSDAFSPKDGQSSRRERRTAKKNRK
jgi:hypothetical protein